MEGLPRDILRLIVFSFLDGPAACAFLQTCKRFNQVVSAAERSLLRIRPRDTPWHMRRVLEQCVCCPKCLKVFENKSRLVSHQKSKHPPTVENYCRRCMTEGAQRALFPWVSITMHLACRECDTVFVSKIGEWLGSEMSCMECGPLCDVCLKLKHYCKHCKKVVKNEHVCAKDDASKWNAIMEWFNLQPTPQNRIIPRNLEFKNGKYQYKKG